MSLLDISKVHETARKLFEAAVGKDPQLRTLLQHVADSFGAYGCILWEAVSETHLSMLGCAFPTEAGNFAIHDLPIEGTVSGTACSTGRVKSVRDVQEEGGPRSDHPFLKRNNMGALISVPVEFLDGSIGTLDLLRKRNSAEPIENDFSIRSPFSEDESERFSHFATLFPTASQALLDRRSYDLVRDIEKIIQRITSDDLVRKSTEGSPNGFDKLCQRVSETFRSIETSLFLLNPLDDQERYEKRSSTWKHYFEKESYTLREHERNTKTGWVIANRKPVHIFDLTRELCSSDKIQERYSGIQWERFDKFIEDVVSFLDLPQSSGPLEERDDLLPLSYIAAPIFRNDAVVGVIRCCGSFSNEQGAGFYSERDLELLVTVAGQISGLWSSYISSEEKERSAKILTRLAGAVRGVNSRVHGLLDLVDEESPESNDDLLEKVLTQSLEEISEVIPKASAVAIRRLFIDAEDKNGVLRFTRFHGPGWADAPMSRGEIRESIMFPVDLMSEAAPRSLGERVVRSRKASGDDKGKNPNYFHLREMLMPKCRHTFCAPIIAGDRVYGVLDILTEASGAFSPQAEIAAEVIGSQLALYFSLFEKIEELENLKSQVDDTYEDLGHQLKGPISQAYFRSRDLYKLVERRRMPEQKDVSALRGLCAKSLSVMYTLSFISGATKPKLERVGLWYIKKLFLEAASDYELAYQDTGTTFYLNAESWAKCSKMSVSVDKQLLPQVVSVVCDNAIKYSFEGTTVEVAVEKKGTQLQLTVRNTGLKISKEEVPMVTVRGWRGATARVVTAEGRGIGGFLCDKIMRAMGGEFSIEPTDQRDNTTVKSPIRWLTFGFRLAADQVSNKFE